MTGPVGESRHDRVSFVRSYPGATRSRNLYLKWKYSLSKVSVSQDPDVSLSPGPAPRKGKALEKEIFLLFLR